MRIPIRKVVFGERYRRDHGDLKALAESIERQGLLQPIGVTPDNVLVFGERRLRACRDILKWDEIDARTVNVTSLVEGEHDENEIRKGFTASERAAIAKAVETEMGDRQGQRTDQLPQNVTELKDGQLRDNCPEVHGRTRDIAAKRAGFSSGKQYERAKAVVDTAAPEVVEAMDKGDVSIHAASVIAKAPVKEQAAIVLLDPKKRREVVKKIKADQEAARVRKDAERIEREDGPNAYTQFLKKHGRLPKPAEARSIARITGKLTKGSAGYETGVDPAEIEQLRKKHDPVERLFEAIDEILAIAASPSDVARFTREFPENYDPESISDRLNNAVAWLNLFSQEWNANVQELAVG